MKNKFTFVKEKLETCLKENQELKCSKLNKIKELEAKLTQFHSDKHKEPKEIEAECHQLRQKCKDLLDELEMKKMKIEEMEEQSVIKEEMKVSSNSLNEEIQQAN